MSALAPKSQLGLILEENVDIFYGHLGYITALWYIL
jgi:hypothetical protein